VRCLVVLTLLGACSPSRTREPVPAAPPEEAAVARAVVPDARPPEVVVDAPVALDARPALEIIDAPMAWSEARAALTLAYRRAHSDAGASDLTIAPHVIILHYTAGNSAAGTRRYFDNVEIEASRTELRRGGKVNVSSHYVVDRDGTIYRLQPDTRFARHCIGLNHTAIGIENVGDDTKWPLTGAQVTANAALVRELAATHAITHLLGHHEVMGFRDHAYYVELVPAYKNSKSDPGAAFMTKVRAAVADLGLAGP
jgi:N-acetyl-anhydromuramyl-L-alanine amidase AmpD